MRLGLIEKSQIVYPVLNICKSAQPGKKPGDLKNSSIAMSVKEDPATISSLLQ